MWHTKGVSSMRIKYLHYIIRLSKDRYSVVFNSQKKGMNVSCCNCSKAESKSMTNGTLSSTRVK